MSRVFISYRRHQSWSIARLIFDRLVKEFGSDDVFLDVSRIRPGDEFLMSIDKAIRSCDALLVIITDEWLCPALHEDRDVVRFEILTALHRDLRVVPVLIGGAQMPGREDLPDSIRGLADRNAIQMRAEHFNEDVRALTLALRNENAAQRATGSDSNGTAARLRVTAHDGRFDIAPDIELYFIGVVSETEDDVFLTHVWAQCSKSNVFPENDLRPLPRRLRKGEPWETWIRSADVPREEHENPYNMMRVRISTGETFRSSYNRGVPSHGDVPGGKEPGNREELLRSLKTHVKNRPLGTAE